MLVQVGRDTVPKGIEHELHSFSTSELCCRHKIRITRNEYDRIDMLFECERGDIQTYSHIHPLLPKGGREVLVGPDDR